MNAMPSSKQGGSFYVVPNDVDNMSKLVNRKNLAINFVHLHYRGIVLGYSGGKLPGSTRQSIWLYCNGRDHQNRPTLCEAKFVHNKDRILVFEHTKVVLVEKFAYGYPFCRQPARASP